MPSEGEEGIPDGSTKGGMVAHAQEEEGGRMCGSLVPFWYGSWLVSHLHAPAPAQLEATLPLGAQAHPSGLGHHHVHLLMVNEPPFELGGEWRG